MIADEDAPYAASCDKHLRIIGFADACTAAGKCAQLPGPARERVRRQVLRRNRGCEQQNEKYSRDDFHFPPPYPLRSTIAIRSGEGKTGGQMGQGM